MESCEKIIREKLLALKDEKYKEFLCKLIPTVEPQRVIGIRTPEMRALAKELNGTPEAEEFIRLLPHEYYEENGLHSFFIEKIKDFDRAVEELDRFLPYVDNWATCDSMRPAVFKKHLPELLEKIREWTAADETYTVRFGIEMLMTFYLDEAFEAEYLDLVADLRSQEYYINMMRAWFFATALAKQYEAVLPYIERGALDAWTHNKAIQKAVESRRITDAQKAYLRSLKVK